MENTFFSSKSNRSLVTIVLLFLIVALAAYACYTIKQTKYLYTGPTTISVTGVGEVMAVPDIGQFSFSVVATGTDATLAQEESGNRINAILAFLKEAGVEEKDIKTESYNMNPRYRYETGDCPVNVFCPGVQVQDGFEVYQSVRVKVRDLNNSGRLIAGVGNLGATNITSLQFTIDDTNVLKAEARTKAINDARAKAVVLSRQLGVRFVKMVGYYENDGQQVPYYDYARAGNMMEMSDMAKGPSLPTGENTVTSQVTITYQTR